MKSQKKQINREPAKLAGRGCLSMKESETRYRRLFETAQDGILILNADTGQITDANPFLVNMLGYSYQDFLGKELWEIGPFRDILATMSAFQELQNKGYIRYDHLPLETREGNRIDVEFVSNAYWINHKRVIQCNIRDITERKQAEEVRLKLESQLQQSQKMEAIATLAGGIAHQFNNILSVIIIAIDLLEMDMTEVDMTEMDMTEMDMTDNKNITWYFESMKNSAHRMTKLICQLVAFARGGKYNVEAISLSDFVRKTLPLLDITLKPSIIIETDLPFDLLKIRADKTQMQMVLSAIISNSLEAIEEEGCLRITCRNEVINEKKANDFPDLVPGQYVSLTIVDNGKGMDEETRGRVFEPFFTTKFQGRGLGMAAVYGIVKNHGGWISIDSQLDHGTRVSIYLPAILDEEER